MKHFMKQAQTYNVRRHIQNETRNPQHSLLVVELRTRAQIPSDKYQYIKPIVPRKDIIDNALMVLSTTYAGAVPSITEKMQKHFRYLRQQFAAGLDAYRRSVQAGARLHGLSLRSTGCAKRQS